MKDNMISHITYFFDVVVLSQGAWGIPGARFADKMTSGDSPGPPGAKMQNRKNNLCAKSCYLSFKTGPIKKY